MRTTLIRALAFLLVPGCADPATSADAAIRDAAMRDAAIRDADSGDVDGSLVDAGGDASETDASVLDAGSSTARVGPRVTDFVDRVGPIVVTSGMTLEGVHVTSVSGPCIRGSGVTDVHIVDSLIGPCGPDAEGVGIGLDNASRIHVEHNAFDDVASGLYVDGHAGPSSEIVFDHNLVERVRGPFPRGQMVQLNHVRGPGHAILCNVDDQTVPGYLAGPEDHVSVYESQGTVGSPIRIAFNRIRGGGPSGSGGGILAGDSGSSYIDVIENVVISPGQYGIAIAGGDHARLLRNIVYAPAPLAWSNVGIYVWNQTTSIACEANEVSANRVRYVNAAGTPNHSWNAGNCGTVVGWDTDNVFGDDTLTADVWNTHFSECD